MLRLKIVVLALALTAMSACRRQPPQRTSAEQCQTPRSQDSRTDANNSAQRVAVSPLKHHHRKHRLQARRKDQSHRSVEQGS
jgi:hypothetical protein